ncbi:hypothetical protein ACFQ5Q_20460 [Luteolibacter ambystomatis]|uniref:hypothetical protein n=1 Tax=Luteolibacter ambystomatis TaxID=2824561 RepID=UPI00362B9701
METQASKDANRLSKLAESDSLQALGKAKALTGEAREEAVKQVLLTIIQGDPELAARELPGSGLSQTGMTQVVDFLMSNWKNPAAALQWADQSLQGSLKERAVSLALAGLAAASPSAAVAYFEKIPPGQGRRQAFSAMLSSWAAADFPAALEWVKSSKDPKDLNTAIASLAPLWVEKDLPSAISFLQDSPDNPSAVNLAHLVAMKRMKADPAGTLSWAAGLEGVAGERAQRSAVISWVDSDVGAAAAYVDAANQKERQVLAPILAGAWAGVDPSAAGAWVAKQGSSEEQAALAVQVAYRWSSVSLDDAAAWAASLPEGPARRQSMALLNSLASTPANRRALVQPQLVGKATEDSRYFPPKSESDE